MWLSAAWIVAPRARAARPNCRAFSLIEMILVLAILVAVAAMSWPALRNPMAKQRLRESARTLRTELARARLAAIEKGVPQQVRYLAGDNRFAVADEEVTSFVNEATGAAPGRGPRFTPGGNRPASAQPEGQALAPRWRILRVLEGTHFAESWEEEEVTSADATAGTEELDLPTAGEEAVGWSRPLVFQPDGTCADATIWLEDDRGWEIEVSLRGLTGAATVGDPSRAETEE